MHYGIGKLRPKHSSAKTNILTEVMNMNNVYIQEFEDKIVFTTVNKEAARLLILICDDANITDTAVEYHCQAWIKKEVNSYEQK